MSKTILSSEGEESARIVGKSFGNEEMVRKNLEINEAFRLVINHAAK